jgi:hypothetical protein
MLYPAELRALGGIIAINDDLSAGGCGGILGLGEWGAAMLRPYKGNALHLPRAVATLLLGKLRRFQIAVAVRPVAGALP